MTIVHPDEFDASAYPLESRQRLQIYVSAAPDRTSVTIPVVLLTGRAHRPRVALVAGVHGDEGVRTFCTIHEGEWAVCLLQEEVMPSQR